MQIGKQPAQPNQVSCLPVGYFIRSSFWRSLASLSSIDIVPWAGGGAIRGMGEKIRRESSDRFRVQDGADRHPPERSVLVRKPRLRMTSGGQ